MKKSFFLICFLLAAFWLSGCKRINSTAGTTPTPLRTWQYVGAMPHLGQNAMSAISFQGQIWVYGGQIGPSVTNEIWASPDGASWFFYGNAPWTARGRFAVTEFNGQLWLTGGGDPTGNTNNEVWSSADGYNWVFQGNAPWSPRESHVMVNYQGSLWVIGGGDIVTPAYLADVWSSTDGVNWVNHPAPPWPARLSHRAAVYQGTLWMTGGWNGTAFNEVWGFDGVNWWVTSAPQWTGRGWHEMFVVDNLLCVTGGRNNNLSITLGDTYCTKNPNGNWRLYPGMTPAHDLFGLAYHNNSIWMIGGSDMFAAMYTDVWEFRAP